MARLKVRELAEERGLNITTLHILIHTKNPGFTVSYPTIYALWQGTTKRPDLGILVAVANALELSVDALIDRDAGDFKRPSRGRCAAGAGLGVGAVHGEVIAGVSKTIAKAA